MRYEPAIVPSGLEELIPFLKDELQRIANMQTGEDRLAFLTDIVGGVGAPTTAQYVVAALDGTLSAERLLTNTATVTWDFATPGQAKATAIGGSGMTHPQVLARTLGA